MNEMTPIVPEAFLTPHKKQIYLSTMEILKGRDSSNGMPIRELLDLLVKKFADSDIPDYLYYRTVLEAHKNEASMIRSGGPHKGYYLSDTQNDTDEDAETAEPVILDKKNTLYEKHLYPLATEWLQFQKDFPNVSSEYANRKTGKKWSNPDVIGLHPIDRFGFFDVEIATMEVKPSLDNWRQWIFEAVSHKRFAERSYFAFRVKNLNEDLESELLMYAEKFQVGVVAMPLNDIQSKAIINWESLGNTDKGEMLNQIQEIVPAPFNPVSYREKCNFFENLGLRHKDDLHRF